MPHLPPPWPRRIAHRGAGKAAPENTLPAFARGARAGFNAFECDVRLSRDGVAFLLHDDDLGRTTNGQGDAGALDWSVLAALDAGAWHSPAFASTPLLTLEALAAWLLARGAFVNLELKPSPGDEARCGEQVARAVLRLWPQGAQPRVLLSSFKPEALDAAHAAAPGLARALLIKDEAWDWAQAATALEVVGIVAERSLIAGPQWVSAIHARGWRLGSYTVNTPEQARDFDAWGVDALITDAIDALAPHSGPPA